MKPERYNVSPYYLDTNILCPHCLTPLYKQRITQTFCSPSCKAKFHRKYDMLIQSYVTFCDDSEVQKGIVTLLQCMNKDYEIAKRGPVHNDVVIARKERNRKNNVT